MIFRTNNTQRMVLDSSGRLLLGTTTEGEADADDLTIATSGNTGISIRSGTANTGSVLFSDGTSGANEYKGYIQYSHNTNSLFLASNATVALTIDSSQNATFAGQGLFSGNIETTEHLNLTADSKKIKIGAGEDLQLFHDSTNSYITNSTGELLINNIANASLKLHTNNNVRLTIANNGHATFSNSVSDDKGNLRSIPLNTQSSAYNAAASDAGKTISISSGGVTIPASTFAAGDALTIINNSGSDQTITCSAITMYLANDTTAKTSLTLAGRGMATMYFLSSGTAYSSGAGLS